MIRKHFQWMLAALMICGLAVITTTSCSKDDDDSGSGKASALLGNWFVDISYVDDEDDEDEPLIGGSYKEYILLNFAEDGTVTRSIYSGNPSVSTEYWDLEVERGTYTVDESAGTITVKGLSDDGLENSKFSISGNKLTLSTTNDDDFDDDEFIITFHRPSQDELNIFSKSNSEGMETPSLSGGYGTTDRPVKDEEEMGRYEVKPVNSKDKMDRSINSKDNLNLYVRDIDK